jgi:transposase InsO family protein
MIAGCERRRSSNDTCVHVDTCLPPEIFNTDQGSQFTGEDWITPLRAAGAAISMDGNGRWIDNIRSERSWRSVRYEDMYLCAYSDNWHGIDAWCGVTNQFKRLSGDGAWGLGPPMLNPCLCCDTREEGEHVVLSECLFPAKNAFESAAIKNAQRHETAVQ